MATPMESSMNVSALKLVDPYVKTILDNASHVALYSFNADSYEWEKINVEGALFVCSRSGEPKHNLMILNRLNTYNLIEPITEGLDLQLQDPFLLYRNVQGQINGIWFYHKEECIRIANSMEKLVKDGSKAPSKSGNVLDMCSLVSKPPDPSCAQLGKKLDDRVPDGTSKRVWDFFAKASNHAPSQPPGGYIGPPPGIPLKQSRPDGQKSDVQPLLQRLMSNPVHTVEQIEKQQRSITPQKEVKPVILRSLSNVKKEPTPKPRPVSLAVNQNSLSSFSSQTKIENGLGFLRIADSTSPTTVNSAQFFNSNLVHSPVFTEQPLEVSELEKSVSSIPVSSGLETPSKPALIPPVVFASSVQKEESNVNLNIRPEPLTKTQLLQAVTYLLKNDSDFINKLHEAYVKSFVDMVS